SYDIIIFFLNGSQGIKMKLQLPRPLSRGLNISQNQALAKIKILIAAKAKVISHFIPRPKGRGNLKLTIHELNKNLLVGTLNVKRI
ncbi:MAG: hypothetical protein Q7S39_10170, partial [Ignavibacteria bacterium]|nr:hypothetical protein [Ignavibacteria bacterium]